MKSILKNGIVFLLTALFATSICVAQAAPAARSQTSSAQTKKINANQKKKSRHQYVKKYHKNKKGNKIHKRMKKKANA